MSRFKTRPQWLLSLFLLATFPPLNWSQQLICENRAPDGYNVGKTDGDGGFQITVTGPEATKNNYVPNEVYKVTIQGQKTRYSTQKFTEFLLVAESEKQVMMGHTGLITTGIFHITDDSQSRYSDFCPDGVTSASLQPKSQVSFLWTAPSVLVASCITFKATVVERPDYWYMDDGKLTATLCPNTPTPAPPRVEKHRHDRNRTRHRTTAAQPVGEEATTTSIPAGECCACDDAKYEVVFEGHWTKETHPKDFPENEWLLHFSDIIGASHTKGFHVWREGEVASEGIRQVAEWGATRHLENELKSKGKSINTIIKARGLWHPNEKGKTSAAFRVDRKHHLMSLVSMLGPSPDWIVGISGFDLCLPNCTWLDEVQVDLYPYDAGSDSGITYMSPNTPQELRDPIRAITTSDPDDPRSPFWNAEGKPMKPLAKVLLRRQRIYPKSCDSPSHSSSSSHEVIFENTEEINRPECAVTEWTPWSDCSVACGKGLRMRKRNYMIPMKANMMNCDRQLVEKEMCLGQVPTCEHEADAIEEMDSICALSDWSEWSPCSVSCGKGVTRRSRTYKNPLGRKKCTLETTQTDACMAEEPECDPSEPKIMADPDCPLTPWSEWSPCSVSCGKGYQERQRLFLVAAEETIPDKCKDIPLIEKAVCTGPTGADCTVTLADAKDICTMPIDVGHCRGFIPRYAFVPEKGMCVPFTYGGCKGNRNRFESESDCLQICSFLATSQVPLNAIGELRAEPTSEIVDYRVLPVQSTTEAEVELKSESTTLSSSAPPPPPPLQKVDCQLSDWSPWSSCSVSCGTGWLVKSRSIVTEAQNGGVPCPTNPRRFKRRRQCHRTPC